jgi:FHS family L-fucose permease-like MFS transporter
VVTAVMKYIAPNKLLALYAFVNMCLCLIIITAKDMVSVYSLMAVFFFESIMFPTIFALGVKNLGLYTKKGASYIIMSIVGGALVPLVMGLLAQYYSTPASYIVPLFCFIVVFVFGVHGYKVKTQLQGVSQ